MTDAFSPSRNCRYPNRCKEATMCGDAWNCGYDDTPAARVIDAQRREKLATERAERAEARLNDDDAEIEQQRRLIDSLAEIAGKDAKRAYRNAKRARRWKRRARAAGCEIAAWRDYGEKMARYCAAAADPAPAAFNPAEAFLHTAPDATPRPMTATGYKTEAAIRREGPHIDVNWWVRGVNLTARVYEPQGLPMSAALADMLALALEQRPERRPSAPEGPAQPQVEPAQPTIAEGEGVANRSASEAIVHNTQNGRWLGGVGQNWQWNEPPTLADWPETALDQPGETVRDMGGRADG